MTRCSFHTTIITVLTASMLLFVTCSSTDDVNSPGGGGGGKTQDHDFIIDHNCTVLSQIPAQAITDAKANLHIAYGHTSHGSQLTTGMTGLVGFAGSEYDYNSGGTGGALDLRDRHRQPADCP